MAYDPKRRVNLQNPLTGTLTAERLIQQLGTLPKDTEISICGGVDAFLHVNVDDDGKITGACIDHDPLDECYPENAFDNDDDPVNYCLTCANWNFEALLMNCCIPEHDPCNECNGTEENHKRYKSCLKKVDTFEELLSEEG